MTDYSRLSDREIDALVAERVCGWKRVRRESDVDDTFGIYFVPPDTYHGHYFQHMLSMGQLTDHKGTEDGGNSPYYSTDRNACREALGKMQIAKFVDFELAFMKILRITDPTVGYPLLKAVSAPPRQICEAMLTALDEETQTKQRSCEQITEQTGMDPYGN